MLGYFSLLKQDNKKAKQLFQLAFGLKTNAGRSWSGLAMAGMLEGQFPQAEQHLQTALTYIPTHLGT